MTFIIRYSHKDKYMRHYSYPIFIGELWDAKRRFGFWRFEVYFGKINVPGDR